MTDAIAHSCIERNQRDAAFLCSSPGRSLIIDSKYTDALAVHNAATTNATAPSAGRCTGAVLILPLPLRIAVWEGTVVLSALRALKRGVAL
eukprot:CAMPEP_0174703098 /NCGR_PEP_ID=MMETSP1094-20130205/7167_1 /TAXON_ID=156173 /ORGANISM="Chrysochromulina brevifilum, Strain UTEX LB 985" /LENGTH=90 /DNA_ID=CAMNT_0015900973 /DNA_START=611 /DNA_END=883 /DNA_ORIENTATION=-